jgi:aspartate aminotransferase-like enzyme
MIAHRGQEFGELMEKITAQLKEMFKTEADIFIMTTSGTGGMEAAVVNTVSPGDKVLSLPNGVFGNRFGTIAETFGADVTTVEFEWGSPIALDAVRQALNDNPDIKQVLVTHNETSTGLTNPLKEVAAVVREFDKLLIVDAISSIGSIALDVDDWGCDVVVTGAQKSWMIPPGLAMVSFNQRAWKAYEDCKSPRFYFDVARYRSYLERKQTPWTPAVANFQALSVALDIIADEGLDNVIARHHRIGEKTRKGVKELGLELFADEKHASDTVTAVKVPEGVDAAEMVRLLRVEYDTILATGQQRLQGKIFRIGHLGYVSDEDIDKVLEALKQVLPRVGHEPVPVSG